MKAKFHIAWTTGKVDECGLELLTGLTIEATSVRDAEKQFSKQRPDVKEEQIIYILKQQ